MSPQELIALCDAPNGLNGETPEHLYAPFEMAGPIADQKVTQPQLRPKLREK
ncbi:MAG: hypothetical protein MJH10_15535 [Epibacterium sp.]|nr:hypothetical protein [Epibacterium sp.]NQX74931.1 hypothetical protein [Epibacterium sp.]